MFAILVIIQIFACEILPFKTQREKIQNILIGKLKQIFLEVYLDNEKCEINYSTGISYNIEEEYRRDIFIYAV